MLKSILVGLDGSEYCEAAANTAIEIAKNLECKLVGLGIIDVPGIFDSSPGRAGGIFFKKHGDQAQYEEAQRRVNACLSSFEDRCVASKIRCEIKHREGSPLGEFIREAPACDVIMFGQRTYFEQEQREGPCNTLIRLLKDTPRPVAVIPKGYDYSMSRPAVLAFDGSMPSARSIQLFTLLSYDDPPGNVHLVTVCDNQDEGEFRQEKACRYIENWCGFEPTSVVVTHHAGPRWEAIMDYARQVNARIIVMGAYGVSGLKSFFFGSTTRNIVERADTMLFLYH